MHADYNLAQLLLKDAVAGLSPAMLHGALTGYICSGAQPEVEIFPDLFEISFPSVVLQLVARLDEETRTQLSSPDFEFQPMLPDDEALLSDRLEALSCWCDWFNIGFAAGFMRPQHDLSPEVLEVLNDFGQLAEADAMTEDGISEHDEANFMELAEYVRMATISIFIQLNNLAPAAEQEELADQEDDDGLLPGEQPMFNDPFDDPQFH